jgi:hypothetical protein
MLQVAAMQPFTLRVRCGGTVLELLHMIAKQRGPPALAQARLNSVPCGALSAVRPHNVLPLRHGLFVGLMSFRTACVYMESS